MDAYKRGSFFSHNWEETVRIQEFILEDPRPGAFLRPMAGDLKF
jgi:hypothetical protein